MSRLFFFSSRRRHTRYIGDWSSDVCSSDLRSLVRWPPSLGSKVTSTWEWPGGKPMLGRSEERRVGKECRSWWEPYPEKKRCRENGNWYQRVGLALMAVT